jgi:CRISPR/Cas system-associated exonuclease Cas4 (RecB family)
VPNITEILLTNYQASKQDRGLEIHCSDLSSCPRRTCFQRLEIDRQEDRQTLKNYLIGALFHEKLEKLLGPNSICEQPIKWVGKTGITVIATPDAVFVDPKTGGRILVEVKTTNSRLIMMEDEPSFIHKKQLYQYMNILGVKKGIILYIFLDNKIEEPFRQHIVTFQYDNQPDDGEGRKYEMGALLQQAYYYLKMNES